jgi:hypothetical protein
MTCVGESARASRARKGSLYPSCGAIPFPPQPHTAKFLTAKKAFHLARDIRHIRQVLAVRDLFAF